MKTFQFNKNIDAPAQKVWDTLWNESTYPQWTKAFNPQGNSFLQSDWKVGGKTLFVDKDGSGMVSTIKSINEPNEIVFEHLGEISNGVEDTSSDKVKNWAGALETYQLKENNGSTTVNVMVQFGEEMEDMLTKGFNIGLEELKKLSEQ